MAGIAEKTRILVLSNVHALLDKAIDLNSTQAVRQYVRDLETSVEQLADAVAEARGNAKSTKDEIDFLKTEKGKLDHDITIILTDGDPSNDQLAQALEVKLMGSETRLATSEQTLATEQQTVDTLSQTVSNLRAKHVAMVSQLKQLETLERSTKAQQSAAKAVRGASKLAGSGANVSVDDVVGRIQRKYNVATEQLKSATGEMEAAAGKDVVLAQAAARLSERKAKLQKQ